MTTEVETKDIDRKYERYRMKSASREKVLLSSILTSGIEEPLVGVFTSAAVPVLLDGFKRLRCAERLKINSVPFTSIAEDEAVGILHLLRISNYGSLTLLEQAKWVDELRTVHGLSIAEIASRLDRSGAWVSVRINVLNEMSEVVREAIFRGDFPAYSFLYTLRPIRRLNEVPKSDIDDFVKAVSGKRLSHRDIEILAHGFFRGGDEVRGQIKGGDLGYYLEKVKAQATSSPGLSDLEKRTLRDLEIVQSATGRLILRLKSEALRQPAFFAQAELLVGGIVRNSEKFLLVLRSFSDRIRKT